MSRGRRTCASRRGRGGRGARARPPPCCRRTWPARHWGSLKYFFDEHQIFFSSINKYSPHRCSEWGTPSPLTSAWPFLVTGPGVSRRGASSRCGGTRTRTYLQWKIFGEKRENYLDHGGAVSSVLIKRLVSNVSVSLESVEVRRQQQCPDKCRILFELSGVGFFNFHQYCACYSTFFLFVIVILYMWKIHTLRIFCYQPIGDGFVDKHIVEWFF